MSLFFFYLVWQSILGSKIATKNLKGLPEILFATHIGKYIPGSIWNFSAQTILLRPLGISLAQTVSVSAIFLYILLASAAATGYMFSYGLLPAPLNLIIPAMGAIAIFAMHPLLVIVEKLRHWRVKLATPKPFKSPNFLCVIPFTFAMWFLQAASIYVLVPGVSLDRFDIDLFANLTSAICLSFAAGLLVPIAPAGLGVREAVLIAMLAPSLGIAPAGAIAILLRLVQVGGDLAFGSISWVAIATRRTTKS